MFNDKQGVLATGAALIIFSASAGLSPAPGSVVGLRPGNLRPVNISLTSFNITPDALHLKAGEPILLRIANDSGMAHDLSAPEFFGAATYRPVDVARVAGGTIVVGPHQNVVIAMVPRSGSYRMKCTHAFHKMLGMSGTIVVDQ
jgi:plastocyanin